MTQDTRNAPSGRHFAPKGAGAPAVPPRPAEPSGPRKPAPARSRKKVIVAVAASLAVLALAAAGVGAYLWHSNNVAREEVRSRIGGIVETLQGCDEVVIPLDEQVSGTAEEADAASALESLQGSYDGAVSGLDAAQAEVEAIRADVPSLTDEESVVLSNLEVSISSRRDMLASGKQVLETDVSLEKAKGHLKKATDKMVEANDTVLESVEASNEYASYLAGERSSQGDPQTPVDLDNDALKQIEQAEKSLTAAKKAFPDADYSAYEKYLSAKKKAVKILLKIDKSIANEDYDAASAKVEEYNEADEKATRVAGKLPDSDDDVFRKAYEKATSDARETYSAARQAAAEADTEIRSYAHVDMGVQDGADASGNE